MNDVINLYDLQLRLLLPFIAEQLHSKYTVIHHHPTNYNNLTSNLGTQTSTDVVLQLTLTYFQGHQGLKYSKFDPFCHFAPRYRSTAFAFHIWVPISYRIIKLLRNMNPIDFG